MPEQFDLAGIGGGQAFADLDGGGLAGAIGSEQAEALAGAHFEFEAVDGDDIFISLAKTCDAQSWLGSNDRHETSIASEGRTSKT